MMSYWILPQSGIPISCVNVQRLTNAEMQLAECKSQMDLYDAKLKERLTINTPDAAIPDNLPDWNRLSLNEDDHEFNMVVDDPSIPDTDLGSSWESTPAGTPQASESDHYLNMELGLPRGRDGDLEYAVVK